jgi:hypothetical protein
LKTYDPETLPRAEPAIAPRNEPGASPFTPPPAQPSPATPRVTPLPAPRPKPSALSRIFASWPGRDQADPARRRLVLGLPGSLVFASPLAMMACGGGGDDGSSGGSSGTGVKLHDAGRAFAGTGALVATAVTVTLPSGVAVPDGKLAAHTLVGGFGKVSGGATMLPLAFGGLQFVTVYTADKLPVLFGFLDSATPGTLDATSTAVALVACAIGAPVFEQDVLTTWVAEIATSDVVPPLAAVIASELRRDVYALATSSPAIETALQVATRDLLAGASGAMALKRARPLGVTINPAGERSGAEPILAETFNTVYVQDSKLRRAYYAIHREGSTDAAGVEAADPARTLVASGDIPLLPAFSSAANIITSVTTAAYGGDSTGLAFAKTPETTLALVPAGAKSTSYSVTVLMAGNEALGFDRTWASQNLTADELRKVDLEQFSTDHLGLQMMFIDILLPMFLGWCGGKIGEAGSGLGTYDFKKKAQVALLGELFNILTATLPAIQTKLKTDPNYGVGAALGEIVTKHLVSLVDVPVGSRTISVPVLSSFSYKILILVLKFIAYEKMDAYNGEKLLTFLEGNGQDKDTGTLYSWVIDREGGKEKTFDIDTETIAHAGMAVALKALGTVNNGLSWLNNARIATDLATSKLVERWELKVGNANVKLTPRPLKIDKLGVSYPVKAEIVDNDNDDYGVEKGSWRFDWVCTGQYGDLFKPVTLETNTFSTSNANATCNYMARTLADGSQPPETITVKAWFEPIGSSKPPILVGQATSTLEFKQEFTLVMSPKTGARLPTDTTMPVYGFFNENLPAGTSVEWTWTHAGVGTLTTPPTDGQTKSHAVSLATGSTAGFTTLSVGAKLTIPGTGGAAGRTVIVTPVVSSYQVDKGVRSVTFEVGGGVFPCGSGCGVTDYTAFIVPKLPGALGYSAVLSGFGYGPCNRTVSWNSIQGDGGGCNFPITGHPFSAGTAAPAWAVWMGFGGPLTEGRCVVTVALPA